MTTIDLPPANSEMAPKGHLLGEPTSNGNGQETHVTHDEIAVPVGPILRSDTLGLAALVLDDIERVRIANENRLRQLTRDEVDKDGGERGFGLSAEHPDVINLTSIVSVLKIVEESAIANLQADLLSHPLGAWCKRTAGVGEKQLARLLAAIGDPAWNDLHNRPRKVSELIAYCGYDVRDGMAPIHRRGQQSNWNETARMRTRLIAESCMKHTTSPYRAVYDEAREKYAAGTHSVACVRCGPKGKPAQPGSVLSAGHQHARALRLVAKAFLKDLYAESLRLHSVSATAIRSATPIEDAPSLS
jgi:hypothetical protein